MLRWVNCGASHTSPTVLMAPQGIPAPCSSSSQAPRGREANIGFNISARAARFAARLGAASKRTSASSSLQPITSQNSDQNLSFATPTLIQPSLASNVSYGLIVGCTLPRRFGLSPEAKYIPALKVSSQDMESSMATSTRPPRPLFSRFISAARTACDAYRPVTRSAMDVPTFIGGP